MTKESKSPLEQLPLRRVWQGRQGRLPQEVARRTSSRRLESSANRKLQPFLMNQS